MGRKLRGLGFGGLGGGGWTYEFCFNESYPRRHHPRTHIRVHALTYYPSDQTKFDTNTALPECRQHPLRSNSNLFSDSDRTVTAFLHLSMQLHAFALCVHRSVLVQHPQLHQPSTPAVHSRTCRAVIPGQTKCHVVRKL